ncbi:MAG: molybdopterin-binding protein, partial [Bacilli bacterium]|nr:molybdopterin-binding protein [Bacilli bacterium]
MKAVILNVGDEVLEGRVINTNGSFLTSNLLKLGIHTDKVVTIGDDRENLQKEITSFMKSDNDLLITTGGLGPTHDDFTKEVLVETLGLDMIINQEAEELLHKYFGENFAECNLKQAYFPQEAIIIPNKLGTADGAIIEKDKKLYIILVGPPFEMNPMFDDFVKPYLKNKVAIDFLIKEYIVMGIGESAAEEILKPLYDKYHMVNIAPYASLGKIRYQITGSYRFENDFNSACSEFKEILF